MAVGAWDREKVAPGLGDDGRDGKRVWLGFGEDGKPTRGVVDFSEMAEIGSASVAWDTSRECAGAKLPN